MNAGPGLLLLLASLVMGALNLPGIAGQIAVYPWLGLFPGLALTPWLGTREPLVTRVTLALAVSPLLSSAAAWLLMRAGLPISTAALAVSMLGWLGCAIATLRPVAPPDEATVRVPGAAIAWAAGLATALLLIPVINPYLFARGDSWLHAAFSAEILERGFPPEDPRMAGVRLNYVWFFNLFTALLASLFGQDLFRFMTLLNVADGFVTVMLVAWLAQRLWNRAPVTHAAAALVVLALNAGAWLLWPLGLARVWIGTVRGADEVARQLRGVEIGTARVIYSLSAPGADMVSFLDKLLVGTALNVAYVHMLVFLWALVRWLGDARRDSLAWLALGAAGMMFFHSVVGLSALPVAMGVLGVAWIARGAWSWLPSRSALAAAAASAAAGALVTLPYMRSITAGWAPEKSGFRHHYLQFRPEMVWTLATACGVVLVLARRPLLEAWRRREALPVLLGGYGLAMAAFALVVNLPLHNSIKFVFEVFVAAVVLAAPAAAAALDRGWRERRALTVALLVALFGVHTGLTVHGYLVDPTGRTREELNAGPGERAAELWLRNEIPQDAVLVDARFREILMVTARRRLYLGTEQPADLAAFPVAEMARRRRTMLDLYGPLARPDSVVAALRSVGRPIFVFFRPGDPATGREPWRRLIEAAPGSLLLYDRDGYRVLRLSPGTGS